MIAPTPVGHHGIWCDQPASLSLRLFLLRLVDRHHGDTTAADVDTTVCAACELHVRVRSCDSLREPTAVRLVPCQTRTLYVSTLILMTCRID
jgi:hypothetical protein